MTDFVLEWDSADLARLQRALDKLDEEHLARPMYYEIGTTIHKAAGVYPSWTDSPPFPYYIRGRGTQFSANYNDESSGNMRERWYVNVYPGYLKVGNDAGFGGPKGPYAYLVHGDDTQTAVHRAHGWKRLLETAKEVFPGIIRKLEARALALWEQTR